MKVGQVSAVNKEELEGSSFLEQIIDPMEQRLCIKLLKSFFLKGKMSIISFITVSNFRWLPFYIEKYRHPNQNRLLLFFKKNFTVKYHRETASAF